MYHLLTEGIGQDIKDVGSLIVAARDGFESGKGGSNKNSLKTYSYSSAAKAASKLIAVFPLLTSRTVSSDTTQMVSKYIEQKGCIILQLALQAANISNAKNGIEYLRNFHQNLDIGGSGIDVLSKVIDAWIDGFDSDTLRNKQENDEQRIRHESTFSAALFNERKEEEFFDDSYVYESEVDLTISSMDMKELLEVMAENENYVLLDTKLNPISINDYIVRESDGDYHVSLKKYNFNEANRYTNYPPALLKDKDRDDSGMYDDIDKKRGSGYDYYKRNRNLDQDERNDREHEEDRARQAEDRMRQAEDRAQSKLDRENKIKSSLQRYNVESLKDQDIKKMNSAIPSLLVVRFYNDSNASVCTEFIIGVKTKVLGVNSDEILRRIANDNKDGKFFLNLMRTLTGELKKSDFLFGLSRTDEDLQSLKKKGAQGDTWKLLQNRAMAAKQAVKQHRVNDYSAITTVLVSQEDCDELFREENIDLTNPSVARHFMESYNLLGFIIADDSTESLKILFDDDDKYFEELSYRMLERETQDGTYKKLINLIASSR